MHGTDPHDEIAYWRERAKAAEEQLEAVRHELGNLKQTHEDLVETVLNWHTAVCAHAPGCDGYRHDWKCPIDQTEDSLISSASDLNKARHADQTRSAKP